MEEKQLDEICGGVCRNQTDLAGRPDQLGCWNLQACESVFRALRKIQVDMQEVSFSPWAQGIIARAYVTSPTAQGPEINNSGPRHHTFSSAPAQNEGVNNTPRGDLENHKHICKHTYMGVCGLFELGRGQSDKEDNNAH